RGFRIALRHPARPVICTQMSAQAGGASELHRWSAEGQLYFRLRRVRFRLSLLAFAATLLRYCSTILSAEAPAIRLVPAFAAASIFSLTMRWLRVGPLCRHA